MQLSNEEYAKMIQKKMPKSPLWKDLASAFCIGGGICCVGQLALSGFLALGMEREAAGGWTSVCMIFLGALLTGLGIYDRLAKHGGAGTLVPVTGFANAVVSPALEFKTEGLITGTAVKMFTIAGPVIVFGVGASVVYGVLLMLARTF